jgi:uncharacterized membrane protein YhaH (DUF805 family)
MTSRSQEAIRAEGRGMTFFEAIRSVVRKFAEFRGRASRSELWWWVLFTYLVTAVLAVIPFDATQVSGSPYVAAWSLVVLLPSLAVGVRRLRDAGRGWGHVLWILLPVAGLIVLVVLLTQRPAPAALAGGRGSGPVTADTAAG